MSSLPTPWLQRTLPVAAKRIVVLDPGERFLKLVVADSTFGRVRLVQAETIDLLEFQLDSELEVREHLHRYHSDLAPLPLVLVIPQNRAISQLLDLPDTKPADTRAAVEAEARKLSGWVDEAMRISFVRLRPFGGYLNPHWLTLCKAEAVEETLERFRHPFGGKEDDQSSGPLWDVLTSSQALLTVGQTHRELPRTAVFVDLRPNATNLLLQVEGQGVFATSLPRGAEGFMVEGAVGTWAAEVKLVLREWVEDHPALDLDPATFPVLLCGSGAEQPGLLTQLEQRGELQFQALPALPANTLPVGTSLARYCVAYGAALHALGHSPQPVSFLPTGLKAAHLQQSAWEIAQAAILVFLIGLFTLLGFGIWQQGSLYLAKRRLEARAQQALDNAVELDVTYRRLNAHYDHLRPVLNRQRLTTETLSSFAALQSVRTNNDFWYVLFADGASYAAGNTLPENPTNRAVGALPAAAPVTVAATATNSERQKFIAEICIPQEGEAMRRILSQVVGELKRHPLFARVDTLPPERKRSLVDPRVVITNRSFALSLELASEDLLPAERLTPPDRFPRSTNGLRDPRRIGTSGTTKDDRAGPAGWRSP